MSSVWLPNSVCSSSRTPSGSPLMDVTIWNRSSFTWARSAADNAVGGTAWLPATTAAQTVTIIAPESLVDAVTRMASVRRDGEDACGEAQDRRRGFFRRPFGHVGPHTHVRAAEDRVNCDIPVTRGAQCSGEIGVLLLPPVFVPIGV